MLYLRTASENTISRVVLLLFEDQILRELRVGDTPASSTHHVWQMNSAAFDRFLGCFFRVHHWLIIIVQLNVLLCDIVKLNLLFIPIHIPRKVAFSKADEVWLPRVLEWYRLIVYEVPIFVLSVWRLVLFKLFLWAILWFLFSNLFNQFFERCPFLWWCFNWACFPDALGYSWLNTEGLGGSCLMIHCSFVIRFSWDLILFSLYIIRAYLLLLLLNILLLRTLYWAAALLGKLRDNSIYIRGFCLT